MVLYKPVQRMAHFQPVLFLIHIRYGTFSTSYTTYLYNEWLNFNSCIPCKEILQVIFFSENWTLDFHLSHSLFSKFQLVAFLIFPENSTSHSLYTIRCTWECVYFGVPNKSIEALRINSSKFHRFAPNPSFRLRNNWEKYHRFAY